MSWFIVTHIFSTLVEFVGIDRLSDREKDLEILILRHQLDIVERKQTTPIKPNQVEKMTLAVLSNKLKLITNRSTYQLRNTLRIFQPATVLKWHRELVRRKRTTVHKNKGGRPKISQEMEDLIVRLANENRRWGYGKIGGELLKLGFKVSQTTIRNVLNRHGIKNALRVLLHRIGDKARSFSRRHHQPRFSLGNLTGQTIRMEAR